MLDKQILLNGLDDKKPDIRLESLEKLMKTELAEKGGRQCASLDVNNHIHTTYSFSPYTPAKAVWMAYNAGLCTAGIMDHDSISGAEEFIAAGRIAGLATTIGIECRVDFSKTPLRGRTINNPDQNTIAYVALHGIPHNRINDVKQYFKPVSRLRNIRNIKMVENLNGIFSKYGLALDFEQDVIPVSSFSEGGSITERHLLFALSLKLISHFGKRSNLVSFLKQELGLELSSKLEGYLLDTENAYYAYDLLGVLKSGLVSRFYVDAILECPDVGDFIAFANTTGGVPAYAYLGDVVDSVTGDKKTQQFEDDYLDLLFTVIKEKGFKAVTYAPSRNNSQQLDRIRKLCSSNSFFQISGEDINQPRQPFICEAMRKEEFKNLTESAWALIGHEAEAEKSGCGLFSPCAVEKYPELETRIGVFRELGIKAARIK